MSQSSGFLLIIQLFFCVHQSVVNCDNSNATRTLESHYIWQRTLFNVSDRHFRDSFLPNYVDFQRDVFENLRVTTQCRTAIRHALHGLSQRQYEAVKLFNSWAKFPPSGLLQGSMVDFGDFDQCLSQEYEDQEVSASTATQYCLIDFAVPMQQPIPRDHNLFNRPIVLPEEPDDSKQTNYSLYRHLERHASVFYYTFIQIGICLPQSCTQLDAQYIVNSCKFYYLQIYLNYWRELFTLNSNRKQIWFRAATTQL